MYSTVWTDQLRVWACLKMASVSSRFKREKEDRKSRMDFIGIDFMGMDYIRSGVVSVMKLLS